MIIEDSSEPTRIGTERAIYVMDNGEGANTPPDRSTALLRLSSLGFDTLDEYCQATPEIRASSVYELEEGDIHVVQFNPVVAVVTGGAEFHRTLSSGETYVQKAALTARQRADGSVEGI